MKSVLNDSQKGRIEAALRLRAGVLREEVRGALIASGEQQHLDIAGRVHDSGDEAVADLLTDIGLKGIERDVGELAEVEAALERLGHDSFGACHDCGGEIGYARLEALPIARRCIACQRRHDAGYAHEATPGL